jgi:hypothetical protein
MTSRSRRKRPIILRLALTATAALSASAFAADGEEVATGSRFASREKAAERIQQLPALRPATPAAKQDPPPDFEEQVTQIKIAIEPPTRAQLFNLQTASAIIDNKYTERAQDHLKGRQARERALGAPQEDPALPMPGPMDRFNVPNQERLGKLWYEAVTITRESRTYGAFTTHTMGVANGMGRYPYKDGPAAPPTSAAVLDEYLPPTDMQVGVDINLSKPENEFGVVVRARTAQVDVPQGAEIGQRFYYVNTGEFYSVTAAADRVELRRHEKGKVTVVKSQQVPAKTIFRLTVRALGPQFRVYRDADEVLVAEDATLTGHFAGVIGVKAAGAPVLFDNFEARGYAGEFLPRLWARSTRLHRGPNVHYNTLYFEQRALERHGHHLGNLFQPFIAHGLFFVDVALLPMSLGRSSPDECYASELYARPGDLVPFYLNCPQPTAKGLLYEAGLLTTIFLIAP